MVYVKCLQQLEIFSKIQVMLWEVEYLQFHGITNISEKDLQMLLAVKTLEPKQ